MKIHSKKGNTEEKNEATQHNLPERVFFQRKTAWFSLVEFKSMTVAFYM